MRTRLRRIRLSSLFLCLGLSAQSALATDWNDCNELKRLRDAKVNLSNEEVQKLSETVIQACTAVIESSMESPSRRAEAYLRRGSAYGAQKNLQKTIADWTKSIELNPDEQTYLSRAHLYDHVGDYERAVKDYKKAIAVSPKPEFAYYFYLSNHFEKRGKWDDAIKVRTEMLKLWPVSSSYIFRGEVYMKAKDYKRAVADFRKALRMGDEDARKLLEEAEMKLGR